jgi:NADH dehydrogenase
VPVLITGATGLIGRALARRLLAEGAQVRAYVRHDDRDLRAAGVHVAIGAIDDVPRLEAALTRVHTVVHLAGGWWPEPGVSYDFLNRETTEAAVISARAAEVRRFLFMSFPGADAASPNEFLAAKGKAEELIHASGLEYAIVRCAPISEGLPRMFARLRRGRAVAIPGPGTQRWNPVALEDVVSALVAADSRKAEVRGTWTLGGPQELTVVEIVRRAVPGARPARVRLGSPAPAALQDLLMGDLLVDPRAAIEQFGISQRAAE